MKHYLLYNPLAGNGSAEADLNALSEKLSGEVVKYNVTEIASYEEFFANVNAEDAVIICGGDGTLNRFINATDGVNIPCDVMYMAAGTGNDFLTDIQKTREECP